MKKVILFSFLLSISFGFYQNCDDFNECTVDMLVERKCVHIDYDVLLQQKCDSGCGNGGNDGYCDSGVCIPFKPCSDCSEDKECGEIHLDFLDNRPDLILHQSNMCVLDRCVYHFFLEHERLLFSNPERSKMCLLIAKEQHMDCSLLENTDDVESFAVCRCRKLVQ